MTSPKHPLVQVSDLFEAVGLLTRLPLRGRFTRGAQAAWAWPLAGALVALIAAGLGSLAARSGLPAPFAAGLVLGAQIMLTGALHEDGLADCADGFWGGHDPARRLEIMKDSHIGTYGVLALGLTLLLRWVAIATLLDAGTILAPFVAAALLSRAPMAVVMSALPPARAGGLGHSVGQPSRQTAALATGLALVLAALLLGWGTVVPAFWIVVTTAAVAALAHGKIGGQTGDVLGATQQLAEITALSLIAATA